MDNTKGNFSLVKDFAKHLVGKFQISDEGTRVGAITFGHGAHIRLLFSDLKGKENNLQNVKEQINRWRKGSPVYDNKTSISEALRVAKDFLFRTSSGMRFGQVEQVLVLFTNAKQHLGQAASTLRRIQELQNKGIKIIIVGIQKPDPIELLKLAGGIENMHWLKSEGRITSIATKIYQSVCSKA
ncbi:unnamed protein product [Porites evermanni]|uniref:VWFA domain-containing protein n=1 Tax=Porites evermanni TaxID=104178 RepID=A0ABN8N827_9CNID|nr:unnamed protein product [Porites evermanni]